MSVKSDSKSDVVVKLPISSLRDFSCHPYKVRDDESMRETAESVKAFRVLVPIIVRPCDAGGYEIISGHRRKRACELADIDTMPAIVRELDDDAATIVMVDSNLQRENVLPSERAQAYIRTSREILAENSSDSSTQIQLYIRLTSMDSEQATPSLSQAQRLKQFSQ